MGCQPIREQWLIWYQNFQNLKINLINRFVVLKNILHLCNYQHKFKYVSWKFICQFYACFLCNYQIDFCSLSLNSGMAVKLSTVFSIIEDEYEAWGMISGAWVMVVSVVNWNI